MVFNNFNEISSKELSILSQSKWNFLSIFERNMSFLWTSGNWNILIEINKCCFYQSKNYAIDNSDFMKCKIFEIFLVCSWAHDGSKFFCEACKVIQIYLFKKMCENNTKAQS